MAWAGEDSVHSSRGSSVSDKVRCYSQRVNPLLVSLLALSCIPGPSSPNVWTETSTDPIEQSSPYHSLAWNWGMGMINKAYVGVLSLPEQASSPSYKSTAVLNSHFVHSGVAIQCIYLPWDIELETSQVSRSKLHTLRCGHTGTLYSRLWVSTPIHIPTSWWRRTSQRTPRLARRPLPAGTRAVRLETNSEPHALPKDN